MRKSSGNTLKVVDRKWMDHIDAMDQPGSIDFELRSGSGMEYKFDYEMFQDMIRVFRKVLTFFSCKGANQ